MKTRLLIIAIVLSVIVITFLVANYTNENDSRNTGNPNECWYQEDDGSMTPCKMEPYGFQYAVTMGWVLFGPYITLGIVIVIIFIVWRKRK